jgi:Tfp pilus assembly protein PilX
MNTQQTARHPALRRSATLRKQEGVVLFIALIVLVAMMLAGIALIRSVDTANTIAGNLAFKQTTLQAADFGIEAAVNALPAITASPDTDKVGANFWYFALRRDTDPNGGPLSGEYGTGGAPIVWTTVPLAAPSANTAGNEVRVVIDRLCRGPLPVDNPETSCFTEGSTTGTSKQIGAAQLGDPPTVFYRVTAQVTGPRNTISMVQAVMSR